MMKLAKAPYQIKRIAQGLGKYLFILKRGDATILSARGTSPIAPQWLRDAQATYNTKAMLDDPDNLFV